jgi:transcriptional regulator with XRE-family HTH domain
MDFMLLGKRIRDERLLLRLTMEQLAERIDKSTNFIGQIERGEGKPSIETLVDIANALGTSVDTLLSESIKANIASDDNTIRAIIALLYTIDDTGKQFILDIVKRHKYHYKNKERV